MLKKPIKLELFSTSCGKMNPIWREFQARSERFQQAIHCKLNSMRDDSWENESGDSAFLDFLTTSGRLDPLAAARARKAQEETGQAIDSILAELGLFEERPLADALASYLQLDTANDEPPEAWLGEQLQSHNDFMRRSQIRPLQMDDATITLATAAPLVATPIEAFGFLLGRKPIVKVATRSQIQRHWEQLHHTMDTAQGDANSRNLDDIDRLRDVAAEAPIIRLLNSMVSKAIDRQASDIHIELFADHLQIRYRIDGHLQLAERLERGLHLGLVSRIKILSRLNIAEQRLPQDGRMTMAVKGRDVDLRVATSPTASGENIVLRVLDKRGLNLDLGALGFSENEKRQFTRILAQPNGIILVTGPTGSGKTTTLYSALTLLNKPDVKVFSIEDPIEYNIRGINQILVRPQIELSFANILRSVLRQDPDVIMVGEIRDRETAQIAVQAALTGHLVLSTLHTNSAIASITRLRDLGIDDFLLASSLRAVIAQRLVRKTCESCAAHGCPACHSTGYSGRTVIAEILPITPALSKAISAGAAENEIEAFARNGEFRTLAQSAEDKRKAGITTQAEILRVLGAGSA
ncbi:MAG: Flp pilus assembly complex ATPase component TadA [Alphaproteobacteria bacterium]|nr:Flp pilus assembly complex ATPase component TadA [Alphaproteobacteria bacterium]